MLEKLDRLSEYLRRLSPIVCFASVLVSVYYALTGDFQSAWSWMVVSYVAKNA